MWHSLALENKIISSKKENTGLDQQCMPSLELCRGNIYFITELNALNDMKFDSLEENTQIWNKKKMKHLRKWNGKSTNITSLESGCIAFAVQAMARLV